MLDQRLWILMHDDVNEPVYQTKKSVGMDLEAYIERPVQIAPGKIVVIPTGLKCNLREGTELQIRPRSGLAIKWGITVVNSPGTIDPDYDGEIHIGLCNVSDRAYTIRERERVAQAVLCPVLKALAPTLQVDRGEGGLGSTS